MMVPLYNQVYHPIRCHDTDSPCSTFTRRSHLLNSTVRSPFPSGDPQLLTRSSPNSALENSAAKVAAHKDAFRFGDDSAAISNVPLVVDTEDGNDTADTSATSLSRNPTSSTYRNTSATRGGPPPGSAAAEGLEAAHGQGMTTSLGAVRGDGKWNEGQVPVEEGEAVGPSSSGEG
jgi:hypothetical protein